MPVTGTTTITQIEAELSVLGVDVEVPGPSGTRPPRMNGSFKED